MLPAITGTRIANDVMMTRRGHPGPIVIVEGDSDSRFYGKYLPQKTCKIIPAHTKKNLLDAINQLEIRGATGFLAITDCDYTYLEKRLPKSINLTFTDFHDLETLLLISPALENILREILPTEKLTYVKEIGRLAREEILIFGLQIGHFRWLNYRKNLRLNFQNLPYDQIIDLQNKSLRLDFFIKYISAFAKTGSYIKEAEFTEEIKALKSQSANPWHVCQGHDLVNILNIILPEICNKLFGRIIGGEVKRQINVSQLSKDLRLAYEESYFINTQLYSQLLIWEKSNPKYPIF